ncbi:MAG: type II secretion system protein [Bacillota bacterium]
MVVALAKSPSQRVDRGFTLAELLVANAVVTIALLGVYGLFRQVLEVEKAGAKRWEDEAAAEAIVDHLAEAMRNVVNLPGKSAITAEPDGNGGAAISCFTQTPMYWGRPVRHAGVSRRRYAWQGGQDAAQQGQLEVRLQTYGGRKNLDPAAIEEESSDAAVWAQTPPVAIGRPVDEIAVVFRGADEANGEWQDRGNWQAGQVVVRIRVRVGESVVEWVVMPRATTMVVAADEEG